MLILKYYFRFLLLWHKLGNILSDRKLHNKIHKLRTKQTKGAKTNKRNNKPKPTKIQTLQTYILTGLSYSS